MDRLLRTAIAREVQRGVIDALETGNEKWITAKELCNQFQMLTPSWVKTYGHLLPRSRAGVNNGEATQHTRWAYPQHKIARLIAEGKLQDIVIGKK